MWFKDMLNKNRLFNFKQIIIVRSDLKMSTGKMISQACHASLESSESAKRKNRRDWKIWRKEGAKKVVLKVDTLENLIKLSKKAAKIDIPFYIVKDRGLTEIPPGTITVLAIGPESNDIIDPITNHLKLL